MSRQKLKTVKLLSAHTDRLDSYIATTKLRLAAIKERTRQRNPIVQGQEQQVETLKREQCAYGDRMHGESRVYITGPVFSLFKVASSG
jgi:hypothetical protein